MPTAQDEFLKDLNPGAQPPTPFDPPTDTPPDEGEGKKDEEPKGEDDGPRNRRERRFQAKYQAERESGIAMAAKLQVLTETQRLQRETQPSEYLKQVERIYGTDSPQAAEATQLLANALKGVEEKATERALEIFRDEQRQANEAVAKEERTLDDMVDDIEDSFNVTLDADSKKGFFQLLEKLSPKDANGNIVAYADAHAVYEELQSRTKRPSDTRAKDLAARSTGKSSASNDNLTANSNERWLRENGII